MVLTGQRPLSRVMHRINSWYASFLNRRYGRRSGVLDGRYKAVLIDHDEYLTELVRYVHLNPVQAGLVSFDALDRYPWTGHAALMGNQPPRFLNIDEVLSHFGGDLGTARVGLRGWMMDGLRDGCRADLVAQLERRTGGPRLEGELDNRILGDAAFVGRVLRRTEDEDAVRAGRLAAGWSVAVILERAAALVGADPDAVRAGRRTLAEVNARALVPWMAREGLGATLTEIARALGVQRSSVGRALSRGQAVAARCGVRSLEDLPPASVAASGGGVTVAPASLSQIIQAAAAVAGTTAERLSAVGRTRPVSRARRLAAHVAVRDHGYRLCIVANAFGLKPPSLSRGVRAAADDEAGLAAVRLRLAGKGN